MRRFLWVPPPDSGGMATTGAGSAPPVGVGVGMLSGRVVRVRLPGW